MIFIITFVLWIVFNAKITTQIVVTGIIFAAFLQVMGSKYLPGLEFKSTSLKRLAFLPYYFLVLLVEIVKANVVIIRVVLSKKLKFDPVIVKFDVDLKDEASRVLLANSITLTPGTITVDLTENTYIVHCLDKSMAVGMEDSVFVKLLKKREAF